MVNDMAFRNIPSELTVPDGATTGTSRIVITHNVPAIIQANQPFLASIDSIIIFYSNLTDVNYTFIGCDSQQGSMFFGSVSNGGTQVNYLFNFNSDFAFASDLDWMNILDGSSNVGSFNNVNVWNSPNLSNGWTVSPGASDPIFQVKYLPFRAVWLLGRLRAPNPFNATVCTLDPAFAPISDQFVPAQRNGPGGLGLRLVVAKNTGVVTASGDAAVSVDWYVNGIYSLDALS
jgi:hypothetical protein